MAATFKLQICYNLDLTISDDAHKRFESSDPALARSLMMAAILAGGDKAHQEALTSAAITCLVSLKNGPQKVIFQNETTKAILRT